eukprot:m.95439 g.95439  ORF g.95439 m.95439 type:complete len:240 (+) comp13896_c0_seq3:186-905(+)
MFRKVLESAWTRHAVFSAQLYCWAMLFTDYVGGFTFCFGPSMLPTVNTRGDIFLTERISIYTKKLKRGDVVLAISPRNPDIIVCKRIIALGGDRVCSNQDEYPRKFITVPRNHVFLQGDNLDQSTDSRDYGPVSLGLVRQKLLARIWPLTQIGLVRSHYDPDRFPAEHAPQPPVHEWERQLSAPQHQGQGQGQQEQTQEQLQVSQPVQQQPQEDPQSQNLLPPQPSQATELVTSGQRGE